MIDIPKNKKLILFDGICNLCNKSVLKVIKYDKNNVFLFTALQSKKGKEIIKHLKIDLTKVDSIILFEPGVSYDIKSTAAIKIIREFRGLWSVSSLFLHIPEGIRDYLYNFIARNRYKWFGKKEVCMIPTPEITAKFIE